MACPRNCRIVSDQAGDMLTEPLRDMYLMVNKEVLKYSPSRNSS